MIIHPAAEFRWVSRCKGKKIRFTFQTEGPTGTRIQRHKVALVHSVEGERVKCLDKCGTKREREKVVGNSDRAGASAIPLDKPEVWTVECWLCFRDVAVVSVRK